MYDFAFEVRAGFGGRRGLLREECALAGDAGLREVRVVAGGVRFDGGGLLREVLATERT